MSRMPDDVRDRLRSVIWTRADELGWSALTDGERSGHYERWTRDPNIGGTLRALYRPAQGSGLYKGFAAKTL